MYLSRFPKEFSETTTETGEGFPIYRRRNDGRSFTKEIHGQQVQMDNRWVVPYNPALSRKYDCHLNVEICASIQAVKYLFMYFHKGHDTMQVHFQVYIYFF